MVYTCTLLSHMEENSRNKRLIKFKEATICTKKAKKIKQQNIQTNEGNTQYGHDLNVSNVQINADNLVLSLVRALSSMLHVAVC